MDLKTSFFALRRNPVALAIFTIGVLAFLYVCILAVKTFGGNNNNVEQVEISQEDRNDLSGTNEAVNSQKQQKSAAYKRQKKIKEKEIIGAWDAYLGTARGLLQIKEGSFRLIIIDQGGLGIRYYINGTYTLDEDILVFFPDVGSKAPSEKYDYQILTRSEFPVLVSKYRGKMIWQAPGNDVDIYVPNRHAILDRVSDGIAVWSALK